MLDQLKSILGEKNVLTGTDMAPWMTDWTGGYSCTPMAVLRPGSTKEVSEIVKLANTENMPVVPLSGNTGLAGGGFADGVLLLSMDRMNRIRDLRPDARLIVAEAGVILQDLHSAAAEEGLTFPLTFGAKGSARVGGFLSTNAGGSNVLRYGNTRDLCLGLEVVLPTGEIMDIMSELHKNNSGYDLRHLMIGAEGTLGIITAAVLKLVQTPRAFATAMVAVPSVSGALKLLNRLQEETGGMVEAFEYMPGDYFEAHHAMFPAIRPPFEQTYPVSVMVEVGSTIPKDCEADESGSVPLTSMLETVLSEMFEDGTVLDAAVAQNAAQRQEMWTRREDAAEVTMAQKPLVNNDIAVPVDKVETFLNMAEPRVKELDADAKFLAVAHLGDGNLHYCVTMSREDAGLKDQIMEAVEEVTLSLGGSFSAEHGIGLTKLPSMQRRKNPVAVQAMRAIKAALDPNNILNPGKTLP